MALGSAAALMLRIQQHIGTVEGGALVVKGERYTSPSAAAVRNHGKGYERLAFLGVPAPRHQPMEADCRTEEMKRDEWSRCLLA